VLFSGQKSHPGGARNGSIPDILVLVPAGSDSKIIPDITRYLLVILL